MKVFFAVIGLFVFVGSGAQVTFNYGVNLGGGHIKAKSNTLTGTYTLTYNNQETDYNYSIYAADEYTFGALLDVFLRGKFKGFFVQGGLSYSDSSPEFFTKDYEVGGGSSAYGKGIMNIFQLHAPLLFGYGKNHFGVFAGPVLSSMSSHDRFTAIVDGNKYSLAYRVGGELYMWDFVLSVFMQNSITSMFDRAEYMGNQHDFSLKANQVFYSIGYFFISNHEK